jgi:hypothetical protein
MKPTTLHSAADRLLGDAGPLEDLVTRRRSEGVSWRKIAGELRDLTGIDVTHETLRSWFHQPEAVAS